MVSSKRLSAIYASAVADVARAATVEEALLCLVSLLRDDFDLWYANVGTGFAEGEHFTIVAAWSAGETVLVAGTQIAVDLTVGLRQVADRLRAGEVALTFASQGTLGLADAIKRDEGVAATLVVPLRDGEDVRDYLVFGSSSEETFGEAELVFFRRLGEAVEHSITRLIRSARQ